MVEIKHNYSAAEIGKIIPFAPPFLYIDKVYELQLGKHIKAKKNVTITEAPLLGHFKDNPVHPGNLSVEALCQAGTFLAYLTLMQELGIEDLSNYPFFLTAIKDVRFKRALLPGDTLDIHVDMLPVKRIKSFAKGEFKASGYCEGQLALRASYSAVMQMD